jgi:hypothetical protein
MAAMAETEPAQPPAVVPVVVGVGVAVPEEGAPPPQRLTEVENALSVLQREAGLTEDTLKVLRKAVNDNLTQPRAADAPSGDDASNNDARKRPFKPSSSKRQQLTAEEAAEVYYCFVSPLRSLTRQLSETSLCSRRPPPPLPCIAAVLTGDIAACLTCNQFLHRCMHLCYIFQIYKQRPQPGKGGTLRRGSMLHCKQVAPKYGVTPKTIRDVWSGRSWAEATRPLWTEDEHKRRNANEEDSKHSLERNGMVRVFCLCVCETPQGVPCP